MLALHQSLWFSRVLIDFPKKKKKKFRRELHFVYFFIFVRVLKESVVKKSGKSMIYIC